MSGIVKRKYQHQTVLFIKQNFSGPLRKISEILPLKYDGNDILNSFKQFYSSQWEKLEKRYEYYTAKDRHLVSVGKKIRYKHKSPTSFFFELQKVKYLLSAGAKSKHQKEFDADNRSILLERMYNKKKRVRKDLKGVQSLEPIYFDLLVFGYHQKNIKHEMKLEIVMEMKKFRGKRVTSFFHKLNDCERNMQIRKIAFEHLQAIDEYVVLRKEFKGKVKRYAMSFDDYVVTPEDLVKRIETDSIQNKKKYDAFLSHSAMDIDLVEQVKNALNANRLSVYCDWISDRDFLKRELVSEYTKIVLKRRIEQSKFIVFIQTTNSFSESGEYLSSWVNMELNYAQSLKKKIFVLNFTEQQTLFEQLSFVKKKDELIINNLLKN